MTSAEATTHEGPECVETDHAAIALIIRGRPRDLGGLVVRRVLPSVARRLVGPFIFLDHMGPVVHSPGQGIDVRPHPHINLATVTYLFEGEIQHKDSLGSDLPIRPGAVNWMTAGRGITHSERTPPERRRTGGALHGLQAWVALPKTHEEDAPTFQHHPAATIPELAQDGVRIRVIVGSAFGVTSPVTTTMPTLYAEARLDGGAVLAVPQGVPELAAYVVEGEVTCGDATFGEGTLVVFRGGCDASLRAASAARVMLLGGASIDGPRHIFWNFVSSSEARLEEAKRAWREERFPLVPGDEVERIPLPA